GISKRGTAGGTGVGTGAGSGAPTTGASTSAAASSSSQLGTCSTVRSSGSAGTSGGGGAAAASSMVCCAGSSVSPRASACFCAASVALKSSASGPSRMLARRRAIEHLLRKLAIHERAVAARVVLQDRLALHRRLGVAHRLADLRLEHEVSEVLRQD